MEGFGVDFKHALRSPGPWQFTFYGFGECLPRESNYVELDPERVDKWGIPVLRIHCEWSDNERAMLEEMAATLHRAAAASMAEFPEAKIDVSVKRQYRNMAEGLAKEPRAVAYAQRALERLGRTAELTIVRGGTDGSRLTELGLPTPNLATGQHAPHSPLEWACLDEMVRSVEWLLALAEVWAEG